MKQLLLSLLIISSLAVNAKNYYISSASGNDANAGTSTTTPWKTISKLNSFTGLVAGDQVLFNRGETFYGSIITNKSGTSGNPIVYGAYGTGANPVITGFTNISSWTSVGSNIWESTSTVSNLNDMNCVVINGVNTAMGRFPNSGYLTTDSHVGTASITSSGLSGSTNWAGADVVMRTWNFAIARNLITAQSGTTLTYNHTTVDNGHDGYGFFIENDARTLDAQNEWYYNPSTKKLRIYSSSTPVNVQATTADTLVYMVLKNYLTFDGIDFIGSNRRAFYIGSCAGITIQNCNFNYHGLYAIWGGNNHGATSSNFNFNHNTVNHVNSQGIVLQNEFVSPYVGYNTFNNCGVLPGMFKFPQSGGQWDGAYGTVYCVKTNNLVVEYNSIDSTGYTAIHFTGNNTRINNNEISNHCLELMDGGGIYTWTGPDGTPTTGSKIYNNIVHNGFGNNSGTTEVNPLCQGLYLDENTRNTEVYNNTFFSNPYGGIFSNSNTNCNIHDNTCYNNTIDQILCSSNYSLPTEREQLNTLKNNIFVARTATQLTAKFSSALDDINNFFTACDSNYYARPIDDNISFFTSINKGGAYGHYNLVQWQAFSGHDAHSKKSPKTITNLNDLRFEYNSTTSSKTITLDGNYIDVKNVSYNGTITLAPYTSAVLIRNGAATNQSPTAKAGNDQTITLPTSTVSLSGSGTDADGTISTYGWTKISGPASGTITSAGTAATTVTGLVQGVYKFQLKVTDNGSLSDLDTIQVTVNAGNVAPTGNAGPDQTIKLPVNTVTLSGSGTDTDGTIASYSWTKISGPASGAITNASSAATTVTGLAQGVYQFQLKVTDNDGATDVESIQVTVNAANVAPTANAGSNQSITLPVSTVSLSGSGTDTDGSISAYSWTKISGPASGTIANSNSASTTVTGLAQGVYQFQLKVTDNETATDVATIQVTVNAANLPPIVNAGPDQTIKLPINTVSLAGVGTDADGAVSSYNWTKISGPASGTITNANAASTTVTGLAQGVYQFQLKVTDNDGETDVESVQITVNAANVAPTANAGTNQTIKLPISTVSLSGSGADTDGSISAYSWTKISGPASGTITSANSASTTITGLAQGVYQFQLKVTDNEGATDMESVQVTVNAANVAPTANAGTNQTIKLPISTVSLNGSGADTDGSISAYSWTKISGPASGTITSANSASTTITGLAQGVYQFQLKVTDNEGATDMESVQVTVNAANVAPTANAGTNQTIKLPISTVSLNGSGADTDGSISAYSWTKISGPASGTITSANSASTTITGLAQGVYQFQLKVTDNEGATDIESVQVTVNAANVAPTANAGSNQSIKLPINTVSLSGSGADTDGSISAYSWTKISGPASGTIANSNSASTTVTGLAQGVYQFQLKVTDNETATDVATVQVTVNAANLPPTANAGADQTIKLPINTVILSGEGTDTDGAVSSYSWTKVSGPASGTITSASAASTTVTGLAQGVYQFQLKVTDNDGLTDMESVQVTVNAANVAPTANAGTNQTIKLPVSTVSLSGSGADTDGSISAYSWTKISGPASGIITNSSSASTTVTGLAQGVYQFQLKVTDNEGATDMGNVQVTVNAANVAPVANAGTNQTIKLPVNTVLLSGSGTDTDGSISAYSWTKISGPASGTITNANSASTTVTGLAQGVYQFQLKVTDNETATNVATVQVTVNAANVAPTANAGTNQTIKLPVNTVSLSGSGTDTDGSISAYSWTKISGPASGTITNASIASTTVTGLAQGVYQFQLKVTDNETATNVATVQVTVNAANVAPTANAGTNQTIKLPINTVSLSGSGTDTDGSISAYSWTKISGPASGTITNASAASTTVTGLAQGVYQFQLKVTDNETATNVATVQVTVNAANVAPTANAGADQTIKLPINTITLSGNGADTDGSISAYSWTKISGPASGTITSASAASTTVTGLAQGVYQFALKVTDNETATAVDTIQVTVNAANVAPTANAGTNQTIKLPINTVSLSGSGTDTDGSISAYSWTKISGPASGTITSATSGSTTVTGLTQGVYQFQLKVTDNETATNVATVQVTVNAANIAPTANAGADQTTKLPINTITLSGSGADTDGSISAYSWTKISGPVAGAITNATAASTTITGLTQGVYQFALKVTDNETATAADTIQVTVNAANITPTANAGTNQTIKLPVNTITLSGSGADTDGSISAYSWIKMSGPASGTITNSSVASTTVTGLTQGVYQFVLKVTDNETATATDTIQVIVNAANGTPTANAGVNQSIKLPVNTVTLSGSGTDPDGSIAAYSWTKISGPASGTITSATAASTTVTGLTQGVYQFQLKVTDNESATNVATVQVTVNAANIAPTANAGADQTTKLPINTVSLSGSGADTDGSIAAYSWTKISGPASGAITNATAASTTVTGLTQGVYQFVLKVTDNETATAVDTIQVTVNAANILPTVNAGIDQSIKLPINTVTLSGNGIDTDGSIAAYSWTKISGPASGSITNVTSASTTVIALTQGVYQFELKVTDNETATAVDTIQVIVNAANILPAANAGTDQSIKLPINTISLSGSGTDTDGSISAYSWTKISGPASGTITNAASAATTVTGLTQGVYQFALKVTDNETATAVDTVQVTVNAANLLPAANAGSDQSIKLPINTVTLSGNGIDTDGSIAAYSWTKISGPASGTITSATAASTIVTALTQGVYQFELKVTDNETATAVDTIQVTVIGANMLPSANAGTDQSITLPVSTVILSGSGTDTDGSISAYSWTKISGPASGTITNATSASTDVTGLTQGVYQFELKVTDNETATTADTIQVTVISANILPAASAGTDQSIKLPINTVTLSGNGIDTDGSIAAYSWTKISGPASGLITNATSASTTASGLTEGVYQFELKVTDNSGAIVADTMQVTVLAANILPVASAGTDQSIVLPATTASLNGGGTDADGSISAYSWTKIAGPSAGIITNANSSATSVTGLSEGVYQFELQVTDNSGAIAADTIQVTVIAANVPPTANAGADQSITLPTDIISLSGSGIAGTITAYGWTKISGPSAGTITDAGSATTTVTGLQEGVYQFELKITDNNGVTAADTMEVTVISGNIPPAANAGADQLITLPLHTFLSPTSTASLNGDGSDPDGSISQYTWTMISGPESGSITDPASPATNVTDMIEGVYQFELTVTDNKGATAVDTVQVTVITPNNIPTVNAGTDQSITLPANTIALSGIAADTDGSIAAYSWTKVSGPAFATITNAAVASTTVAGLTAGVYQFELKVTDNKGATVTDTIQVTVIAGNVPPAVNAGTDQSITLPVNTVSLTGNGTDTDGSISAYSWTKISGPASGTITNATSAATTVTGLAQGVYQFALKAADNKGATASDTLQVTVNSNGTNIAPIANAGSDVLTVLPTNTVTLNGTGTDPDGNISAYRWMKISGPMSCTVMNSSSASTTVTSLVQGVYKFQLRVMDNRSAMAYDTLQVIVNVAPNVLPKASAGADQAITLPTNTVSLNGIGTDPDGSISAYRWMKVSGPMQGAITNATSASASLTSLVQGVYRFQFKITDNRGGVALDTIQITVNTAPNVPPTANAGVDQIITAPVSSVSLNATGTDTDGNIAIYRWMKISGPLPYLIMNPASASTSIIALAPGVYRFQLKVTDNRGATAVDTIQITVNSAPNVPPTAKAGVDQSITLPTSSVLLNGAGTDTDGIILAYRWAKISGPVQYAINNAGSGSTTVTSLVQGVYTFQLKVTDNKGATTADTMQVTVNAANIAPTANAGANKTIVLPVNTTSLAGSGVDQDGTVANYNWTKISGPASCNIVNPSSPVTNVSALLQGTYRFQLKVTDNRAAIALDTVEIIVNAGNIAPVAEAGANQVITLPKNITNISGSGTDSDGVVSSYKWTKVSGPSAIILTPNSKSSAVLGLSEGTYKFQLEVTDNKGAVGRDSMLITVIKAQNLSALSTLLFNGRDLIANRNIVYQNVPNPFASTTTIKYKVVDKAPVKIIVSNAVGLQVAVLANEVQQPGTYQVQWNAGNVPSGNYYYTIIIGDNVTTKSMFKAN